MKLEDKMKVKDGGAITNLIKDNKSKIETISVNNDNMVIHLWINNDVLSYLNISEAIELRDELNRAIKQAAGV